MINDEAFAIVMLSLIAAQIILPIAMFFIPAWDWSWSWAASPVITIVFVVGLTSLWEALYARYGP